ncbi:MAG: DUF6688 family protein [Flavobacteriales bacterium]
MIYIVFGGLTLFIILFALIHLAKDAMHWVVKIIWTLLFAAYILFWALFLFEYSDGNEFWQKIESPSFYSPLSARNSLTFWLYHILSVLGLLKLWSRGRQQAPLLVVFFAIFVLCGLFFNVALIVQLSTYWDGNSGAHQISLLLGPIIHVWISLLVLLNLVKSEAEAAHTRSFKHATLQRLNEQIKASQHLGLWIMILFLPFFIVTTLMLILFGQEFDSFTKVFTETTTWHFSQKTHPPYLDHQGHYLCTVAACGSPQIVKPLRLGNRHGHEIIVNRQLMIANAFEAVIEQKFPKLNEVIRKNYDRHGYPLSKDINTPFKSNMTYVLMKPLEWCFLIFLYLTCEKPEQLIHAQYEASDSESLKES